MKTCIVVPTHDRFDLFCDTISNIQNQNGDSFEVLVTDDSSNFETSEKIRNLCSKDHRFLYFKSGICLGQSKNTNFGFKKFVELSNAEFVKILHSDDLIHPDCLSIEREILCKTQCEMVFNDIIPFITQPKLHSYVNFKIEQPLDILTTWANIGCAVPSCMTFSRKYLEHFLMNEDYNFLCDWQLFIDILISDIKNGRSCCHISPGLIGWRVHSDSTTNKMYENHYEEHKKMISHYCDSEFFEEIFSPFDLEVWRLNAKRYRENRYEKDKQNTKIFLESVFEKFEESNDKFHTQTIASHIQKCKVISISPKNTEWSGNGWTSIGCDLISFSTKYDNNFSLNSLRKTLSECDYVFLKHPNNNIFFRKIIYETCREIRVGQHFVVKMIDNKMLCTFGLKSIIEEMFPGDFKFIQQDIDENNCFNVKFLRQNISKKYHKNSFDGISICYMSQGKRPLHDQIFVEKYKEASFNSKIQHELICVSPPHSEIAKYSDIHINCEAEVNLCAKKNLACEKASFSDILVLHDRYFLPQDFFERYRLRANKNFSIASCKILNYGKRGLDWAVASSKNYSFSVGGLLPYKSYSDFTYAQGGATFIKKMFWNENPWNENINWQEHEDIEISRRAQRKGEIISLLDVYIHSLQENYSIEDQMLPYDEFNDFFTSFPKVTYI